MKNSEYKDIIFSWIDTHQDEFWQIAQYLWDNPELGLEEFEASALLVKTLKDHGFSVETGMADMPTKGKNSHGNSPWRLPALICSWNQTSLPQQKLNGSSV